VSALSELRSAKSRYDIATLLGYKPSSLSFILHKIPAEQKYTRFDIKKKGGGARRIDAPTPQLKGLQKRLGGLLYACILEIEEGAARENKLSHAFRKRYSIITNARVHKSRRYVLNLDLKDFFPSLRFGRVRGFFATNKHFRLPAPVAVILAQIACNEKALPQGSPCSPVLSELLTHFLDIRLVKFAAQNKCSYSRYADDLTFSTNRKEFPKALATPIGENWAVGDELKSRIENAGFEINDGKTRMQVRNSRQTVTGLTVNQKVNVSHDYYKRARAMTHSFLATGVYKYNGVDDTSVRRLEC
jgi:RNA-directed DNA polymerase